MARRFPHSPDENPRRLFSEVYDPSVLSGQFWAKLFRYRPLFLLGVFWLTLICIAAVAYSRLMFSGVPVNDPVPSPNSAPPVVIRPVPREGVAPATTPSASSISRSGTDGQPEDSQLDRIAADSKFPWRAVAELASLVGLCALGSGLIAHQAKRPARPQKRRKMVPKAVAKRPPAPSRPKRLSPYSPDRDQVVVPGAQLPPEPPLAPPPSAVAAAASQPSPRQPASTALASQSFEPHATDVVPDHEAHPLDWSDDSIAHTLDLRQRRSLSSFM
jgi:hypothetical protein